MIDLNEVNVFIKVVEAGSFVGAGSALGMPSTTVSRKVQQLEESLSVRLLHRSTRRLSLTDQGRVYFEHCQQHLLGIEQANLLLTQLQKEPKGTLRITSPMDFAYLYAQPWINEFLIKYPEINIELKVTDHQVDLIDDRIDIAFRSGVLKDSDLIARQLTAKHNVCCASPSYLTEYGMPNTPRELAVHQCILWGDSLQNHRWQFQEGDEKIDIPVTGRFASDTNHLLLEAAAAGLGIARAPLPLVEPYFESGALKRVLEDYDMPAGSMHIIYQSHKYLTQNIRLFVDHVIDKVSEANR
ncbi:LysR family transcriptional regulator [Photobacterium rosenbergii]|uniref:LysR family transcriptional regulator n=1 Tax=Photobacterium rosenbergii TaxID=294936 RepID=UPI0021BD0604|nr:LysR family transcriptional regulator [Photobacterium rosenbergii]